MLRRKSIECIQQKKTLFLLLSVKLFVFVLLSSLPKTREELQADLAIPIEYKISVIVHLLLLSAAAAGEAAADDIWVVK